MSATLLKRIAFIFMLIDHIGVFIPGSPIWFRWIGRILGEWGIGLIAGYPIYTNTNPDIFLTNYQWMMIFALPLILLYNGKRGNGRKYFYYWFYPIHLIILTLIPPFFPLLKFPNF